eukprot:7704999-Ditylum_brightwellii.AAC.1
MEVELGKRRRKREPSKPMMIFCLFLLSVIFNGGHSAIEALSSSTGNASSYGNQFKKKIPITVLSGFLGS